MILVVASFNASAVLRSCYVRGWVCWCWLYLKPHGRASCCALSCVREYYSSFVYIMIYMIGALRCASLSYIGIIVVVGGSRKYAHAETNDSSKPVDRQSTYLYYTAVYTISLRDALAHTRNTQALTLLLPTPPHRLAGTHSSAASPPCFPSPLLFAVRLGLLLPLFVCRGLLLPPLLSQSSLPPQVETVG